MPNPKKSVAEKKTKGNPSKQSKQKLKVEAALEISSPLVVNADPPNYLTAKAKEAWGQIFPALRDAQILTLMDMPMFSRYCDAWAAWMEMDAKLQEPYAFNLQVHYAKRALTRELLDMEKEMGMTPASRTKVRRLEPKKEKSEWEGF
jgi:P27 family predicted phage terminase small subunit